MDTQRDLDQLNLIWASGQAPWMNPLTASQRESFPTSAAEARPATASA